MNLNRSIIKNTIFFIITICLLIIWKLPSFQEIILNIDELEWIYCINKCYKNPIPFIGFDSHTTGPLGIYLLLPLKLLMKSPSVVALRIYGFIVFLIPTLIFVFASFKTSLKYFVTLILVSLMSIYEKDFFAYNTEYPLLLFNAAILYLMLKENKKNYSLSLIITLIVMLPFIKFQAILLSAFYFIIILYKDVYLDKGKVIRPILTLLIIVTITSIFIGYFIGLKQFMYSFIFRNIFYANSFSTKSKIVTYIENIYIHFKFFGAYYLLIVILFVKIILDKIKENTTKINFLKSPNMFKYVFFGGLFIISFISIIVPKTNFPHYYLLMFLPITYMIGQLSSHLYINNYVKSIMIITLIIPILNFYNDEIYHKLIKGRFINKLSYEQVQINSENNNKIIKYLKNNYKEIKSIVVLGWFESLPFYYKLSNRYDTPYRSGHSDCLISNNSNEKDDFEVNNFILDLKNEDCIIIDLENVIPQVNHKRKIKKLLKNYKSDKYSEEITFYIQKNLYEK
jgi:hypothetical protein